MTFVPSSRLPRFRVESVTMLGSPHDFAESLAFSVYGE